MKIITIVFMFVLMPGLSTFADEVHLVNGGTLHGIARKGNGKVVVQAPVGRIELDLRQVQKIVPRWCAMHEFEKRQGALGDHADAEDYYKLANWARENQIWRYVAVLAQRAVEKKPDHAGARALLGQVLSGGKWMTKAQHRSAQGYVVFRGRSVTPPEREAILSREAQLRKESAEEFARAKAARLSRIERTPYSLGIPWHSEGARNRGSGGWFGRAPWVPYVDVAGPVVGAVLSGF